MKRHAKIRDLTFNFFNASVKARQPLVCDPDKEYGRSSTFKINDSTPHFFNSA